ncbi:hypothetical protein N431DRAFT_448740 [Stipitochalara longipes BDJ]|nr:hypothetical protein N431DRAFT_448740 [Stipitochalara longipes BDJ]
MNFGMDHQLEKSKARAKLAKERVRVKKRQSKRKPLKPPTKRSNSPYLKAFKTCENEYIPHHRNLGLKPGASSYAITAAWRRTSVRLSITNFAALKQVRQTLGAQKLVDTAYTTLLIKAASGKTGPKIDASEVLRRSIEKSKYGPCHNIVKRKPWFWDYKQNDQYKEEGTWLCGASGLPLRKSQRYTSGSRSTLTLIYAMVKLQRYGLQHGTRHYIQTWHLPDYSQC